MTRIVKGSSEWQALHEARLAIMRSKFEREYARIRSMRASKMKRRPQILTPKQLGHAVRIAAKIARDERNSNPMFVEALEIAATYFDEIVMREQPST